MDKNFLVRDEEIGVIALCSQSAGLFDHLTSHVGHSFVVLTGVATACGRLVILPSDVNHLGKLVGVFALKLQWPTRELSL